MSKPPLPKPQLNPAPITGDQYCEYTPQKLELWNGFYDYGDEDFLPFYLAVLTNMGVKKAVEHIPLSVLLKAIADKYHQHPKLNSNRETNEEMLNSLNQGLEHLEIVANHLESE